MFLTISAMLIIAWGVFAIVSSIVETNNNPSVGGAAIIVVQFGVVAIVIGSLILWLA